MAPGLLLLHGFTGSPASWSPAVEPLGRRTDILAPWLVGHGEARTASAADFEAEIGRIAALAAGHSKWHLAGYSLGGRIAIGMLCTRPELFSGVTLIGAQPGLETEAQRAERRAADERWCALLRERGMQEFVAAWEAQPLFASQCGLPREVLERQRTERLAASADGLVRSLEATGLGVMPSYWHALRDVRVPVTLVAGALDEKFSSIAQKMAARLPNARIEIVRGSGHNVLLERPAAVTALLAEAIDAEARR